MVHHRICPLFMFDLDLGVTQNITQYPLRHMEYAPGKFEVAMSNDLGEDKFLKKIHYMTLTQGSRSRKCSPVPSTARDLCTCIV